MTTAQAVELRLIRPTKNVFVPEIGDIDVYGIGGWLVPFSREEQYDKMDVMDLTHITWNGWCALDVLGIDTCGLEDKTKQECPHTDLSYWAVMPLVLMSYNLKGEYEDRMRKSNCVPRTEVDMAMDSEWHKHMYPMREAEDLLPLYKIRAVLMGTGYTHCIMQHDGFNELQNACLLLSNGDLVACKTWVWFNK